jgi:hypothetical protein
MGLSSGDASPGAGGRPRSAGSTSSILGKKRLMALSNSSGWRCSTGCTLSRRDLVKQSPASDRDAADEVARLEAELAAPRRNGLAIRISGNHRNVVTRIFWRAAGLRIGIEDAENLCHSWFPLRSRFTENDRQRSANTEAHWHATLVLSSGKSISNRTPPLAGRQSKEDQRYI